MSWVADFLSRCIIYYWYYLFLRVQVIVVLFLSYDLSTNWLNIAATLSKITDYYFYFMVPLIIIISNYITYWLICCSHQKSISTIIVKTTDSLILLANNDGIYNSNSPGQKYIKKFYHVTHDSESLETYKQASISDSSFLFVLSYGYRYILGIDFLPNKLHVKYIK